MEIDVRRMRIGLFYKMREPYQDEALQKYLIDCTPFRAKKHIIAMSDIFNTLNEYTPNKVIISLKMPRK